jgi:hypothetical protein
VLASFNAPGSSGGRVSVSLLGLAQGWIDGTTPNRGVLLDQATEDGWPQTLKTSEALLAKDRPALTVCYDPG